MFINCLRKYYPEYTASRLFVNGTLYGAVLEDPGRPEGNKFPGVTCIPAFCYRVMAANSPKFGRRMPLIWNCVRDGRDWYCVNVRGVKFTGIRPHAGAEVGHTEGCPLVGERIEDGRLIGSGRAAELEELILAALDAGENVYWAITEDPE